MTQLLQTRGMVPGSRELAPAEIPKAPKGKSGENQTSEGSFTVLGQAHPIFLSPGLPPWGSGFIPTWHTAEQAAE